MVSQHQFGGQWTEDKLDRLRRYLLEYTKIMKTNVKAKTFTTYYVDAFAGTGSRFTGDTNTISEPSLFDDADDAAAAKLIQRGSAQIALEIEPPFDRYIFVDIKPEHVQELEKLRQQFPNRADQIKVEQGEANTFLQAWCKQMNPFKERAVVFLDPYGMSVNWKTIEAIAQTKSIDLWILFPLGVGVNRLLTRDGTPSDAWARKLTTFFGTDEWETAFYRPSQQLSFLDDNNTSLKKEADFDSIREFFRRRLKTVFVEVAQNSLTLLNSRNSPIYLLYFAASNPKGAPIAVRIANYILGR